MVQATMDNAICSTCNNMTTCYHFARRGPVFFCEQFDDHVLTVANPHDPTSTDLVVLSRSADRLPALGRRLGHYGKYSWLMLPAGRGPVIKGNWQPAASPLTATLEP